MSSTPRGRFPGLALLTDPSTGSDSVDGERTGRALTDGAVTDLVHRWWRAAASGGRLATGVRAEVEPSESGRPAPTGAEHQVSTDHANLSVASGEVLVKFLADPPPPDATGLVTARHLAAVDEGLVPRLLGTIVADTPDGARVLAVATHYLGVGQEGWAWFRDLGRGVLEAGDDLDASIAAAARAGALVARFHAASAAPSTHRPDPVVEVPREHLGWWVQRARETLADARTAAAEDAERCAAIGARLAREAEHLTGPEASPLVMTHGDLHVGQLLLVDDRLVLTDLDGDPSLAPEDRDRAAPAAKDLAALLRSLDHAGRLAAMRAGSIDLDDPRVDRWVRAVRRSAADAYLARLRDAAADRLLDRSLVGVFETAQLAHELHYAATRLTEWQPVARAAADAWLEGRIDDAT